MKIFKYLFYDKYGKKVEDIYTCKDIDELKNELKKNNKIFISATEIKKMSPGRLKEKEIVFFIRSLGDLLTAGLSLKKALKFQREIDGNKKLQNIILNIEKDMDLGINLYKSFQENKILEDIYISILKTGEISGNIAESFNQISNLIEKKEKYKNKIKTILIYPILTIITSVAVTIFITFFILPNIVEIFSQNNTELPYITKFIIQILEFIKKHFILLIGGIFFFICIGKKVFKKYELKYRIPLLKRFYLEYLLWQFTYTLYILMYSGISLSTALELSIEDIDSLDIKKRFKCSLEKIKEGENLSTAMENNNIFEYKYILLLKVGEESGAITKMFEEIYKMLDTSMKESMEVKIKMLEPVLIIILGLILGAVVIGLYLPIFSIVDQINI